MMLPMLSATSVEELRSALVERLEHATDAELISFRVLAADEKARLAEMMGTYVDTADAILELRMRERGAKSIPHPEYEIALDEKHSGYSYDIPALREAAAMLPAEEGAKMLKRVPEQVIPAHDEPGSALSIAAIARKYAGSEVAAKIAEGMRRDSLGFRVSVKRRPTPIGKPAGESA